ncbi:hypothetical protein K503DRAFT_792885 [Rhizopogon vinicolor AM-OR11-026]|uniref:Uncharacterized protein n=1 Tax=Rhizopogon vinicolor AM-OR11-026 TaxID=1314800 RepID=A0A1B7MY86_9AGAM|nr:hypothetical protein K503DRAFT_792885 [Rhizopogon vinicolor AM-OR11-026]
MDTDKIKIFGARVINREPPELERAEREKMKMKVEAIASHSINCFVNRPPIYNYPESLVREKYLVKLGKYELIEEITTSEDKLIKLSCVTAGEARTAVLHALTDQIKKLHATSRKTRSLLPSHSAVRSYRYPLILADNARYDSSDLIAKLRAAHYEGQSDARLGPLEMNQGTIGSTRQLGVSESHKLKRQVVLSASEAAEMIILVDDILPTTPRRREAD